MHFCTDFPKQVYSTPLGELAAITETDNRRLRKIKRSAPVVRPGRLDWFGGVETYCLALGCVLVLCFLL